MNLNHTKIQEAINDLCLMKIKLANLDTMFIAFRLGEALKNIGNDYAELCLAEKDNPRECEK